MKLQSIRGAGWATTPASSLRWVFFIADFSLTFVQKTAYELLGPERNSRVFLASAGHFTLGGELRARKLSLRRANS
jgi:hypothetical protein